ncbi:hypothetical protein CRUP_026563, partial [Coryphaenoides rupestris]
SHDSFTFWVDVHAPVGPDQKPFVQYLVTVFRHMAKNVMVKWSMTQNLTFKEQLDAGIRYFDLRVSSKPSEPGKEIYFIHGLFGHKVVFLDFNHHYAMGAEHHAYLIRMLKDVFGGKLCRASAVETFLETTLQERSQHGSFHVSQAILTPKVNTVAKGLVWGLRSYLVERSDPPVNLPAIMTWVESQKPGVGGVNIITSDFVELTDFADTVIKLNNLLLSDRPAGRR